MADNNSSAPSAQHYDDEVHCPKADISLRSFPKLERASSHKQLGSIGLISALENDPRTSFVIDIASGIRREGPLDLLYLNPALGAARALLTQLRGGDSTQPTFANAQNTNGTFKLCL